MLKFIIKKYKSYRKLNLLLQFSINGFVLFLFWVFFYKFLRYNVYIHLAYEATINYTVDYLLYGSKFITELFGFETIIKGKVLRIIETGGVRLDRGCMGRNLIGMFAGFIIAYPGNPKNKLWYIPLGVFFITIINMVRISGLVIISSCCPDNIDINHYIVFQSAVLILTFLMWGLWINKFRKK